MNLSTIVKKLPQIKAFLTARGAEMLAPTNAYEVLRFRTSRGLSVLYRKENGGTTSTGEAQEALKAFATNGPWTSGNASSRRRRPSDIQALLARDGNDCFLCLRDLGDDVTREHLLPIADGGADHIANMVLTHARCNQRMGHFSLMEKISMREQNLLAYHRVKAPNPVMALAIVKAKAA